MSRHHRNADSTPRSLQQSYLLTFMIAIFCYAVVAYLVAPLGWSRYVHRHPSLEDIPGITTTGDGHPGDPLNFALVGAEDDLKRAMLAAGYWPADPLTLRSCLGIAEATVLKRPYDDAPVSNLFLFGRHQDLAFERPVGNDPRRRHHARLWRSPAVDPELGQPIWIGQTSFDARVGLSHTTGQITHHIDGNVDAERNYLMTRLQLAGQLTSRTLLDGFHQAREGRNGGGDRWWTDGRLALGILKVHTSAANVEPASK